MLANVYLHYALDLWFEKWSSLSVAARRCCAATPTTGCAPFATAAMRNGSTRRFPKRLGTFNLEVAPEKTRILRFSRFHPSMKRRFTFLGFEFFWKEDRQGGPRVMRRTARKKLQGACRRIKEWIKRIGICRGVNFSSV